MAVLSEIQKLFSKANSSQVGKGIDEIVDQLIAQRLPHERRWYDNNFFDDGYHFRTISKKTGRVIDTVNKSKGYVERNIPRASRQIRGVTNLLYAAEPYPVVYPERISVSEFMQDGQLDKSAYEMALKKNKEIARRRGIWLSTEWEEEQELTTKIIDLLLLAAKNSISYLQVYSDPKTQEIKTKVRDAFDVVLYGDKRELKDLPFITVVESMNFKDVLNNPIFDPNMLSKLTPDNKYATSEIKDAYMRARFGSKATVKDQATVLVKESYVKEVLTEDNWEQAVKLGGENGALEGKSKGDNVMRHIFSSCGVTLKDEYIDYDDYPLADFRFEPGPLYQVPFIERFIPQNKSLDIIVTRLEKWINAMIVGVYQKRKGENYQVSNFPGGQMMEYETTPLTQMQNASVGNTPFNVIELLNKFIDEQGASTSALAQVPSGVKSGVAIESLKATEYANLKISTLMLKKTLKKIANLMMERADKDILEPKEVSYIEDDDPKYFDVIGKRGFDLSQQVNKELPPDVVVIDKNSRVRIEIEPGLGLTMEGKKEAMQQIINYMIQIMQTVPNAISMEALTQVIKRFMEVFGYGSTQEFMEAMDEGTAIAGVDEETLKKIQVALAQTLQDTEAVGPKAEEKQVKTTQLGVLTALKESGIADKLVSPVVDNPETAPINYKDAPPSIKRQMEAQAGFQPATDDSPSETEQKVKTADVVNKAVATNKPVVEKKNEQV